MDTRLSDMLKHTANALNKAKRVLPVQLGNMGTRYWLQAFRLESWEGIKWAEVKRRIPGTPEYLYPKKKDKGRRKRNILFGKSGGTLGGAHLHLRASVNTSLTKAEWNGIEWKVPVKYAKVHNEGLQAGRGAGFKMPKRQFMGNSKELRKEMRDHIIFVIEQALRPRK